MNFLKCSKCMTCCEFAARFFCLDALVCACVLLYVLGCSCTCLDALVCAWMLLYVLVCSCMCLCALVCAWMLLYVLGCSCMCLCVLGCSCMAPTLLHYTHYTISQILEYLQRCPLFIDLIVHLRNQGIVNKCE